MHLLIDAEAVGRDAIDVGCGAADVIGRRAHLGDRGMTDGRRAERAAEAGATFGLHLDGRTIHRSTALLTPVIEALTRCKIVGRERVHRRPWLGGAAV